MARKDAAHEEGGFFRVDSRRDDDIECVRWGGGSSPQTAPLTLRVTDSPIDQTLIDAVCIRFARVTVHYAGQDEVTLDYNPLPSQVGPATHCMTSNVWNGQSPVPPVRVSALGGPLTVALAESLQVPVGRVTWIRLHFAIGSYVIETNGGEHVLACASCEPTDNNAGRGFKLNRTFEVESGGLALTVDIHLLSSLHQDSGGYVLRPTARVENTAELGTIAGLVADSRIPPASRYVGTRVETGCAVYAYNGDDPTIVDDYHSSSAVVSSARVRYSEALGRLDTRRVRCRAERLRSPSFTRSRSLATRTIRCSTRRPRSHSR